MTESLDTSTLSKLVLACVDAQPASLRFSPIRTGKHNTSYWAESDQGRFVLRIAPPDDAGFLFYERLMMRQEPGLHHLIRATTTIPVAEVISHDFGRRLVDRDYLIMAALPGLRSAKHQDYPRLASTGPYIKSASTCDNSTPSPLSNN